MPTAVVIIAARDAAHWLRACVDSVLAQHIPSGWDVGVAVGIDACAPTLALASQFSGPRLAIRFFPEHVGPYIIFNSLACATRSDVLVRFDADDIMLQGYLKEQLRLIEPNSGPTIIQTWSIYVDAQLRPCAAALSNGTRTPPDGRRPGPSDGQFLMTRSVFEQLGSFRGWPCHADSEFLRRAKWNGIHRRIVTKHLYLRRVHLHSLTASKITRYDSGLRRSFGHQIEEAGRRYARGDPPEWVYPVVARYVPVGS